MTVSFAYPIQPPPRSSPGQQFGARSGRHTGLDMGRRGNKVLAAESGTVKIAALVSPRGAAEGRVVYITHADGYETRYCHLDSFCVKKGAIVSKGQQIAIVGETGLPTHWAHLHFEILLNNEWQDPVPLLPTNPNVGGNYVSATKLPPDCPNATTATAEPQTVTKEETQVPACR